MDSLANYGSDDDCDSPEERHSDPKPTMERNYRKPDTNQTDTNYDDVGMDLSEDSDEQKSSSRQRSPSNNYSRRSERDYRASSKNRDDRNRRDDEREDKNDYRSSSKSRDDRSRRDDDREDRNESRNKYRDDRNRDRERDYNSSRYSRDERDRDRDRSNSRYSDKDRDRDTRDDKRKSDDKDDRKYSRESYRKRSSSKDRRRSKSPRRSRSRSRDRSGRNYSKRYDRTGNKMDKLDKMGITVKRADKHYMKPSDLQKSTDSEGGSQQSEPKDRFFMPGITGRFKEQIERRKMLWQKKAEPDKKPETKTNIIQPLGGCGGSRATKVWETTTFAQDTDGKVASKFKRLMGIRTNAEGAGGTSDVMKKQEEMFSSMEQQYEVARTATHTMRGVGLGFGSYQK